MTKSDAGEALTRVVVGMATCGIAAGATPVFKAIEQTIQELALSNITVTQTGCIGMCQYEPIVEITVPGEEKVTYVQMNAEKAAQVVKEHLANGKPVADYTVSAATE
ncbi:MAG: (2Fe-2S) ferredoxin domain-containing protein [Oscillospiraceae bacterium]|nr:(2Fe-2S) ferredoxin domain-containing protein [Oscillospiraceae bacterium]